MIARHTWHLVVMTNDGQSLCVFEDGRLVALPPCSPVVESGADLLCLGIDADGQNLWNGRIDVVVLLGKMLSDAEATMSYYAAVDEFER